MPRPPLRSSHSAPTLGPVPTRPDSASYPSRAAPLPPTLCPYRRFGAGPPRISAPPASLPTLSPRLALPASPVTKGLFRPPLQRSQLHGPLRRSQSLGSREEGGAGVARRRRPLGQRMKQRMAAPSSRHAAAAALQRPQPPSPMPSPTRSTPETRMRLSDPDRPRHPHSRPAPLCPAPHHASSLPSRPPTPRQTC